MWTAESSTRADPVAAAPGFVKSYRVLALRSSRTSLPATLLDTPSPARVMALIAEGGPIA
jgi:hypothetical protein